MKLFLIENLIFLITVVHSFPFPRSRGHDFPPFEPYPSDDLVFDNGESRAQSQAERFGSSRRFGIKFPEEFDSTHFHEDSFNGEPHISEEDITDPFTNTEDGVNSGFPFSGNEEGDTHLGPNIQKSIAQTKSEVFSNSNEAFSSSIATSIASSH